MKVTKLIKLAPMLIMITFLAYAGYSINTTRAIRMLASPA